MYTELTQLPLLQGMNAAEITQIQKQASIYNTNGTNIHICTQGEVCNRLYLLLKGSVIRRTSSAQKDFEFEETLFAPWVIEPESLYGLHCMYRSDYITAETCTLMTIEKPEMAKLFTRNDIFRMNYLNLLSANIQYLKEQQMQPYTSCTTKRLIYLIRTLSSVSYGSKTMRIKMEDLAAYMNETRLNISRLLNHWQDQNLIKLQRKEIHIPRLENLISHALASH